VPKIALTDLNLRSLKAPEKGQIDYWDSSFREGAFAIRLSQGGTKTFVLKLDNTRRAIGRYPLLTLSQARIEAKRLLAERTLGKIRPQSITFTAAKELFLAEKKKTRRARTHHNLKQRIDLHFKFSGQLSDFTHHELVRKLGKIKSNSEHDHALSAAKTFFTWCQNRRYIDDNPCRGLSAHGSASRARILTDNELKLIWQACEQAAGVRVAAPVTDHGKRTSATAHIPASYRTIVKLLILTGQRKNEIASLQTSWINEKEKTITLPPNITKNGREHTLPIGAYCAEILSKTQKSTQATNGHIFSSRTNTGRHFNGWSKAKAALDEASGVTGWTLHDLRRTYRTIHARIGTPPHIAERLVNHISSRSAMEEVYDRHTYLAEMQNAVEAYEQYLLQNVVS
jgi:integrase